MSTTQQFKCQNEECGQVSTVRMIEHYKGVYFVVCEHCSSRNKLVILPNKQGEPLKFEVFGLV